jgi:hypothetical protein
MKRVSEKELLKRKFRKFLYDNDALEAWYINRRNDSENWKSIWNRKPYMWIIGAFVFVNTVEGSEYWMNLSQKWSKIDS